LAIFPLVVGAIFDNFSLKDSDQNWAYYCSSMFFTMISCVVFCVAIVLEIWDHKTDKILDKVYLHKEKKEEIETESKKEELEDSGCENDLKTKNLMICKAKGTF